MHYEGHYEDLLVTRVTRDVRVTSIVTSYVMVQCTPRRALSRVRCPSCCRARRLSPAWARGREPCGCVRPRPARSLQSPLPG